MPRRSHREFLSLEQITDVVRAAAGMGITKVRLTGGEPLVKRGIVQLVGMLAGVDGLAECAMTTNGTLLARLARPLRAAGLDRLNVSLDTLDPDRYGELTRGGRHRQGPGRACDAALAEGFPVKINMVVLDDTTEAEIERMREFCQAEGARLQLINHYSLAREEERRVPVRQAGLPARAATGSGSWRTGCSSRASIPTSKSALDFSRLEESLREAVLAKPARGGACTRRAMPQIGG